MLARIATTAQPAWRNALWQSSCVMLCWRSPTDAIQQTHSDITLGAQQQRALLPLFRLYTLQQTIQSIRFTERFPGTSSYERAIRRSPTDGSTSTLVTQSRSKSPLIRVNDRQFLRWVKSSRAIFCDAPVVVHCCSLMSPSGAGEHASVWGGMSQPSTARGLRGRQVVTDNGTPPLSLVEF